MDEGVSWEDAPRKWATSFHGLGFWAEERARRVTSCLILLRLWPSYQDEQYPKLWAKMVPSFLPLLLSDITGQQCERDKILHVSFKSTINILNSGKDTGRGRHPGQNMHSHSLHYFQSFSTSTWCVLTNKKKTFKMISIFYYFTHSCMADFLGRCNRHIYSP